MTAAHPHLNKSRVFACLVVVLVFVTSCGRPASVGPPEVMVARDQRDLTGTWFDAQGRPLPDGTNASNGILVIQAGSGSTSCSTDDVTVFIELAWPAGRRLDWNKSYGPGDTHRYIRQTKGSLMATDRQSDLDTELPASAKDSGIQKDGNAIFTITSKPEAIWIRRGDGQVSAGHDLASERDAPRPVMSPCRDVRKPSVLRALTARPHLYPRRRPEPRTGPRLYPRHGGRLSEPC